jgi:hypothetical protein
VSEANVINLKNSTSCCKLIIKVKLARGRALPIQKILKRYFEFEIKPECGSLELPKGK